MADATAQSNEKPAEPAKANQPRSFPLRKGFPPRKPRFKGETEDLNGNVFETLEESRNPLQFKKTMEALQRYSSKTYSYVELDSLFDDCEMPTLEKPVKPSEGSAHFGESMGSHR